MESQTEVFHKITGEPERKRISDYQKNWKKKNNKRNLTNLKVASVFLVKLSPTWVCHPRNSLSVKFRERSELNAYEPYANRG